MATLVLAGGEWNHWSGDGPSSLSNMAVDAAAVRSGSYGYRVGSGSDGYGRWALASPTLGRNYFARVYFRAGASLTSAQRVIGFIDGSGFELAWVQAETNSTFTLRTAGGTVRATSSSVTITDWHCVEVHCLIGSGAVDATEGRIDGTSFGSASSISISDNPPATAQIGYSTGAATTSRDWDDLAVHDETGLANTTWPGEGYLLLALPTSDGVIQTWTAGAGGTSNLYAAIDNVPPAGVASASETNTSNIESADRNQTNYYDSVLTDYTTLGVGASDEVLAVMATIWHGEDINTGTKTGRLKLNANPSSASVLSFSFGGDAGAHGAYPTGWANATQVEEAPTVTLGNSIGIQVSKWDTTTRVGCICAVGAYVHARPGTSGATIAPTGLSSAETHGSHTLVHGAVSIAATGISSAEAFGTDILRALYNLLPSGIGSAEAFGSDSLLRGGVSIQPTGLASAESFGASSVLPGGVIIVLPGIATGEAIGAHTLAATTPSSVIDLIGQAIASAEGFGSVSLLKGGVLVQAAGLASAAALGSATLLPGDVFVNPSGLTSLEALGVAALLKGGVSVNPAGVGSSEAFGAHSLKPGPVVVVVGGVGSAEAIGVHTLTNAGAPAQLIDLSAFGIGSVQGFGGASLIPGLVNILASGISTGEGFGTPFLNFGQLAILPTAIPSGESFGSALLRTAASILASGIATGEALGTSILKATATVQPSGVATGEALGANTLRPGPVAIVIPGIVGGEVIGSPLIVQLGGPRTILVSAITTAELFGVPVAAPGGVKIAPTGLTTAEVFGTALLTSIARIIAAGVPSEEAFGGSNLLPGMVRVNPSGILSVEGVGPVRIVPIAEIGAVGITSAEALGNLIASPGAVLIGPDGIVTSEAIGLPRLVVRLIAAGWRWDAKRGFVQTREGGWPSTHVGYGRSNKNEG